MHIRRPLSTLLSTLIASTSLFTLACASEGPSSATEQSSSTTATPTSSQTNSASTSAVTSSASSLPTPVASSPSTPTSPPAPPSTATSSSSATTTYDEALSSGDASSASHDAASTSAGSTAPMSSDGPDSNQSAPDATTSGPTGSGSPSAGCGKSGRPNDGKVYVAGEYWLTFPSNYDGSTPFPVLFGFHGCGEGNRGDGTRTEYTDLTQNNILGQDYVVAAPVSADGGGCWNYNTDVVRAKQLYDAIVTNYCVDTARAFATGHSSGAQFVVQLYQGNHSADAAHFNFKGVAPVAASAYNHSESVPVMYIQNQNDTVRGGSGKDVVDDFVAANQCANTSTAYPGVDACQSGGTQVAPGCVQYDSCGTPTIWCSHNDPQYSNTGHGVPCFAAQAMDHFFKSL